MDLTGFLQAWEYDPENTIRLVTANDGRQVMQVRLPLGIEQYELEYRPDGSRPFGRTSMLEEAQIRLEHHIDEHQSDSGFVIDSAFFELLQSEGLLYYYRYVLLFQIGDYERAARDSGHNLSICTLVEKYCEPGEEANSLLQYKPYILRVNALSRAMIEINLEQREAALAIVEKAIDEIEELPEVDSMLFQFERMRSLDHLRKTLKQLESHSSFGEISEVERLEAELEQAVENENYERAAEIRDEITLLRGSGRER
jgi:tetratricopeptide (TPR) repeat protein